jgi:hypothetical protein
LQPEWPYCNTVHVLTLDCGAVIARIDHKLAGNVAAVSRSWPVANPPHRSTILRWVRRETLPRSAHELLAFSAALDLDPFALWGISPATFPALCARLVKASRAGSWADLLPALSFLAPFVGPTADWPPAEVAMEYFHRNWVTANCHHPAVERRNYFAAISIEPQGREGPGLDQVWHFAWRDDIDHALWRPYGFVRLTGMELRLFSFNGLSASATIDASRPSFTVETWFGEGAAAFRVASLHRFGLKFNGAVHEAGPVVRFGFP